MCPLLPGDLIIAGTPAGSGQPPDAVALPGEVLVSRLEGVGDLRQSFVA